jgi:hypothetical protein
VLLKELRELAPQHSESITAYCLRVEQLSSKLASVVCPQGTQSVIHDMLSGLERQRPACAGLSAGHESRA